MSRFDDLIKRFDGLSVGKKVGVIAAGFLAVLVIAAAVSPEEQPKKGASTPAAAKKPSAEEVKKKADARAATRTWEKYLRAYLTLYVARTGNKPVSISIDPIEPKDLNGPDEYGGLYGVPSAISAASASFTTPLDSTERRVYTAILVEQSPGRWRVLQNEFEDKSG